MESDFYNTKNPTAFSTYLALLSFSIGTLLLVSHLVFPREEGILILGFFYVLFAILINSLSLLNLCYLFITEPENRETNAIRILILLSNIPIALLYFYIVIHKN
jgi:hypothetical protein